MGAVHQEGQVIKWKFEGKWGAGEIKHVYPALRKEDGVVYYCERADGITCLVPEDCVMGEVKVELPDDPLVSTLVTRGNP